MVARTPLKQQKKMVVAPPLSPTLLRETVKKVDKCMARLQELQYAVNGGRKVISGVSLSPRSTRSYLRTSLRCKQESIRIKNANSRRSPPGKMPIQTEEWRRMSLPAMLLGETMGEILQASQFARNIVDAVVCSNNPKRAPTDDPTTPVTQRRKQKAASMENSEMHERRKKEKQLVLQTIRSESNVVPPTGGPFQRAKSRINFKVSPIQKRECDKENCRYIANRVSPRNRPWARKTVLFPNPLFHSSSPTSSHNRKFCKIKSPVIGLHNKTPHKFLVKSPPSPSASKFRGKVKSPPPLSISPTRSICLGKKSPKMSGAARLRRSFSPSRLANRLVSPLKGKKSVQKIDGMKMVSGLKQRPKSSTSVRFSPRRM